MFAITVDPVQDGERYVLHATARDVLRWERTGTERSVVKLLAETTLVDAYALAYVTAKRTGQWEGSQSAFEENHDIVLGAPEPAPDPTRPAR